MGQTRVDTWSGDEITERGFRRKNRCWVRSKRSVNSKALKSRSGI
jgi:hypothetical protein